MNIPISLTHFLAQSELLSNYKELARIKSELKGKNSKHNKRVLIERFERLTEDIIINKEILNTDSPSDIEELNNIKKL